MNTDFFKTNTNGISLVQKAIKELQIEVTSETTVQDLHRYHNAITAYVAEELLNEIKKNK
jgi:hypothetical protein